MRRLLNFAVPLLALTCVSTMASDFVLAAEAGNQNPPNAQATDSGSTAGNNKDTSAAKKASKPKVKDADKISNERMSTRGLKPSQKNAKDDKSQPDAQATTKADVKDPK